MNKVRSYGDPCGVARGLDVIGERWALLVVRDLLLGPKRFNDLHSGLPGVSPNVLTQRLRDLTKHGVVQRRELPPPARVSVYELTEWGRELEPLLLQLGRWGSQSSTASDGALGIDSILLSLKAGWDPAQAAQLRGLYELRLAADAYLIEVSGESLHISRGYAEGAPDATLTTDLDTLRDLCDHQVTIAAAQASGSLHLDGAERAKQHLARLLLGRGDAMPSAATHT